MAISRLKNNDITSTEPKYSNFACNLFPIFQLGGNGFILFGKPTANIRTNSTNTYYDTYAPQTAVDSSGNIYTVGYFRSSTYGARNMPYVMKTNSSGAVQWLTFVDDGSVGVQGSAITFDGSSSLYIGCYSDSTIRVHKVAISDGSTSLIRTVNTSTFPGGTQIYGIAFHNNFVYIGVNGQITANNTLDGAVVIKIGTGTAGTASAIRMGSTNNSNYLNMLKTFFNDGVLYYGDISYAVNGSSIMGLNGGTMSALFHKGFSLTGSYNANDHTYDCAGVDVGGTKRVYWVGRLYTGSESLSMIVRTNTTGTVSWKYRVSSSSETLIFQKCAADSSGNFYALSNSKHIVKFDQNGSILWQRKLNVTNGTLQMQSISISGNHMIISGYVYGTPSIAQALLIKLPTDGTLTGTYAVGSDTSNPVFNFAYTVTTDVSVGASISEYDGSTSTQSATGAESDLTRTAYTSGFDANGYTT